MYKLSIKREKQPLMMNSKINVLLDGMDMGEIKSGETKVYNVDKTDVNLILKGYAKDAKLKLKLFKDEEITIKWNRSWGYIQVNADKGVIEEQKGKTNFKNIFIYILGIIAFLIAYYLIWG